MVMERAHFRSREQSHSSSMGGPHPEEFRLPLAIDVG